MNRRLLSALAAGTLLASGAAALAQTPTAPPPPPPHAGNPFFDEMDTNKDGVVTRAEVTAVLDKRFAALDTDHNGTITQAERQARWEAERTKRFDERFAAMDTDHNGQLSPAELRAGKERKSATDQKDAAGKDAGAPPPRGPGFGEAHRFGRDGRGHGGRGFGRNDGPDRGPNGGPDAKGAERRGPGGGDVTKEQFSKRALTLFDVLDSNDDGKITAAERDAAPGRRGFFGPGGGRHDGSPKG